MRMTILTAILVLVAACGPSEAEVQQMINTEIEAGREELTGVVKDMIDKGQEDWIAHNTALREEVAQMNDETLVEVRAWLDQYHLDVEAAGEKWLEDVAKAAEEYGAQADPFTKTLVEQNEILIAMAEERDAQLIATVEKFTDDVVLAVCDGDYLTTSLWFVMREVLQHLDDGRPLGDIDSLLEGITIETYEASDRFCEMQQDGTWTLLHQ